MESASLTNGKTKPPARFTEATLLGAMENPVHFMESHDKKAAKEHWGDRWTWNCCNKS